jgi:hypothetical protein
MFPSSEPGHAMNSLATYLLMESTRLSCPSNWEVLDADLRSLLFLNAEQLDVTEYGRKYTVTGSITGPNGRAAEIVSVWIILAGEEMPRFVTAYPKD